MYFLNHPAYVISTYKSIQGNFLAETLGESWGLQLREQTPICFLLDINLEIPVKLPNLHDPQFWATLNTCKMLKLK